jgi:hypothetical protein
MLRQMNDEILSQGPGFTIVRTYKADTSVPYSRHEHENGDINYGWLDLRSHPERVPSVPEAKKNKGLADLLLVMAQPCSEIMSSTCECALFENTDHPRRFQWVAGGLVTTMFLDAEKNANHNNLINLAIYIVSGITPNSQYSIAYEMYVEPLKRFFSRTDCFVLTIKPFGFANAPRSAWSAFQYAATAAANAIQREWNPEKRILL